MVQSNKKSNFLYYPYVLFILTIGFILAELGHFLIGVTSKKAAIDLDYGDHACQKNVSWLTRHQLPVQCSDVQNETECVALHLNGTNYCEWNYNGLGLEYQLLAGPSFMIPFTIAGIFIGIAADKYNRVKMLSVCTLVFAVAVILQGAIKNYWQFIVLRIIMAAGESGCTPLAAGIMSDVFPEEKLGLVMAIFNWGVFGGYGLSFPIGRYITNLNIFDLSWRICYYGCGIVALVVAVLTGTTLREPERKAIGEDKLKTGDRKDISLFKVLTQPRMILLLIAASLRQCGGYTFSYNTDLYYNTYFPDADLGWYLFSVSIVVGSCGVIVGGYLSDKIALIMGTRSRVAVLAISQLIAAPFAFGSVYFDPTWAMITLGFSFFFAEMWLGILFAVLVEILPLQVRSTTIGIFLFVINQVGGNLPILVHPVAMYLGYRESLMIFYAGFFFLSSVLFFITMLVMEPNSGETNDKKLDDTFPPT